MSPLPLRILLLEDSEADVLLIKRHLAHHQLPADITRIDSNEGIALALEADFDLMLSDYSVPGVDFLETLHRVHKRWPDMPIILVSGSVGEERAVDLLHQGVTDFVLKENLIRLIPSIRRAMTAVRETLALRTAEIAVQIQQERVRASEKRLKLVLGVANDGWWDWDMISDEAYFSPRYYEIIGFTPEERPPVPALVTSLIHPDDQVLIAEHLQERLRGEAPAFGVEFRLMTKSGDPKWVFGRGSVVSRDDQGQPLRMVGAVTDITARKLAELALADSESKFRLLAENATDCIFWVDPDRRLRYISPAAQQVLGHSPEEFRADPGLLRDIVHPDDRDLYLRHLRQECAHLDQEVEFRVILPDGRVHWVAHRCWPVHDENGVYLGRHGTNRDISEVKRELEERRRSAETLQEAVEKLTVMNTELERFAMVAAHDLREPVRSVSSFAQLLKRRCHDKLDDEERQYLDYLTTGAQRIYELIGGLLDYSRVPANAERVHLTSAESACSMALDNLAALIGETDADILRSPLPEVEADDVLLMQLFQNLIGNALKFRDHDRRIQIVISAERRPDTWCFAVRDNGIGFDSSSQDVFELFRQLQPGRRSGVGAGLAICKRIVQRLGGQIWVESLPGHGSTFYFTLPSAEPSRPP